jgi:cellulose biosynthesis protein BcsQ
MKIVAFFNNKGGVGKTTLVYHLAWMMSELGHNTLVVDLDPQANLSSMFLSNDVLVKRTEDKKTIMAALQPMVVGIGDIQMPYLEQINLFLHLIIGDLNLATYEDSLSESWTQTLAGRENHFRNISSFYRIIKMAAEEKQADYVFIDVGPNLGAINRAALIAADTIIIPVSADLFSIQGMANLGSSLNKWRKDWTKRLDENTNTALELPKGKMNTSGYILSQHGVRESRPVQAYLKWAKRIPIIYRKDILNLKIDENEEIKIEGDEYCLGQLKHYRSLMPMAMEVNKPIFMLKPGDGAIGAHFNAVKEVYEDFKKITLSILHKLDM